MSRAIVRIVVQDNVSPVLKAIDDAVLTLPETFGLPFLPEKIVDVQAFTHASNLVVRLRPSPDLLSWLADLHRLANREPQT